MGGARSEAADFVAGDALALAAAADDDGKVGCPGGHHAADGRAHGRIVNDLLGVVAACIGDGVAAGTEPVGQAALEPDAVVVGCQCDVHQPTRCRTEGGNMASRSTAAARMCWSRAAAMRLSRTWRGGSMPYGSGSDQPVTSMTLACSRSAASGVAMAPDRRSAT